MISVSFSIAQTINGPRDPWKVQLCNPNVLKTASIVTQFYVSLKMEHLEEQLRTVGITSKDSLKLLKDVDIEKLPIPPGFRIKLKKALLKSTSDTQQQREEDIESIIDRRNCKRER